MDELEDGVSEDELFDGEVLESEEEVDLSLELFESFESPPDLEEESEDSEPELAPDGTLESVT